MIKEKQWGKDDNKGVGEAPTYFQNTFKDPITMPSTQHNKTQTI
jgi:hypothetical protein